MTDSTLNANSGEGALDVGSTDDLFGDLAEDSVDEGSADGESTDSTESDDGVADQTAAAVFGQLQESVSGTGDVDDVLEDESPDDIIASADEPEPEPSPVDDDLLLDEGELEDLLLTDRTKEQEFLWVETADDESGDDPDFEVADETADGGDGGAVDADTDTDTERASLEAAVDDESAPESDAAVETDSESGILNDDETDDSALEDDAETAPSGSEPAGSDETGHGLFEDRSETGTEAEATDDVDDDDSDDIDASTGGSTSLALDADDDLESTEESEETEETALVADDNTDVPATTDDDDGSGGLLGWLRSTLGGLF